MTTTHTTSAELQTLREAAGLSRDALAELAQVQARTVKHWETRTGAAVPADVGDIVCQAARWVATAAREGLRQVLSRHEAPAEVALIRYRDSADMHAQDRAQGLRADVHGAMVARLVLDLGLEGFAPRVVWFDPEAYSAWLCKDFDQQATRHRVTVDDTPAARAAWAAQAIDAQAIPHPADQPPAGHTPAR